MLPDVNLLPNLEPDNENENNQASFPNTQNSQSQILMHPDND